VRERQYRVCSLPVSVARLSACRVRRDHAVDFGVALRTTTEADGLANHHHSPVVALAQPAVEFFCYKRCIARGRVRTRFHRAGLLG
jgi:hypothetical protein